MKNKIDLQLKSSEDMKLIGNAVKAVNLDEQDKISVEFKYDEVEENITYNLLYLEFCNFSDNAHNVSLIVDNRETNRKEDAGTFLLEGKATERIDFIDIVPYMSSAYTGLVKAGVDILGENILEISFDNDDDIFFIKFNERDLMKKYNKIS